MLPALWNSVILLVYRVAVVLLPAEPAPMNIVAHLLKAYAAVAAGVAQVVIRAVLRSVAHMLEVYAVIQLSVVPVDTLVSCGDL
ncbi:hypothetical protein PILCRDRAFT_814913 [Piloderma croceum F 1598]|uniref:Uncharacterized protein n=1 Tax=Piloderma croceum (strain F 1598) TaxID=765440 RepID=A0A0C3G9U6_PILCF|nr:hypothetical protein PILCRDRAFT_814913 [Piloderma croceum F 1598]